jgi:hypothetical protein
MKVISFSTVSAGLAVVVGAVLYATGPGFRTTVNQHMNDWIGWTEAARQADPVGFTNHVEGSLKRDLATMHNTRDALNKETATLATEIHNQEALAEHAERLATEFRDAYQQAHASDSFPVTVRNAAYTAEQVESQVSLLLAEAAGYRAAIDKLTKIRQQAEQKLEEVTVRIANTDTQLAALPAERELLRARVLSDAGQELVASVDALLEGNRQVIQGNPVRSVAELIATPAAEVKPRSSLCAAREYLAGNAGHAASSILDAGSPANSGDNHNGG